MKLSRNASLVVIIIIGCIVLHEFEHNCYQHIASELHHRNNPCKCVNASVTAEPSTKGQISRQLVLTTRIQATVQTTRVKGRLGPTFLLIMVPILASSSESRDLIRSTWYKGFRNSKEVMLRYIMGINGLSDSQINKLHKENKTHGDLVFLHNFTEGTRALTNKTIALMKWATDNVDFTYLMKCDDDTFVYVHNVIRELKRRSTTKRLYYGMMMYDNKPIHNNEDKWRDLKWEISKKYLPFARGGCYMLSEDLVHLLVRQRHHLKRHHLEDVAVGLWLAPFDYERRNNDHLFCYFHRYCKRKYRLAFLCNGLSDEKLKWVFHTLYKELLDGKIGSVISYAGM